MAGKNWQRFARYACILLPIRDGLVGGRGIGSVLHGMRALCCQFAWRGTG